MSAHQPVDARYEPLHAHLAGLPYHEYSVSLRFTEIEAILSEPLPAEAYEVGWWFPREDGSVAPLARAWLEAGFGVSAVFDPTGPTTGALTHRIGYREPIVASRGCYQPSEALDVRQDQPANQE
jgi:hypothetical protein